MHGRARCAVEVDIDAVFADAERASQVDRLVISVDAHAVLPRALRQLANFVEHGVAGVIDDHVGDGSHVLEAEFVEHLDEPVGAGLVAGRQRIQVTRRRDGIAYVRTQDVEQCLVGLASAEQVADRQVDAFLEDLRAVGPEAEAADVGDVRGGREQRNRLAAVKHGRDNGEVIEMPGAVPRVVRHEHVAGLERVDRMLVEEEADTRRHRVDMAGRAGHGLGEHASSCVEHARGKIARFANRRRERRAHQRLCLFLDDGEQAVPHDLQVDAVHG